MDYLVCAHKAIDQEKVAAQLKPAVDPSRTTIVIIQNGVGNEEAFRNEFPQNSILTCVVRPFQALAAISKIDPQITDLGRGHADQPGRGQAHQVRGHASRAIPQFAG